MEYFETSLNSSGKLKFLKFQLMKQVIFNMFSKSSVKVLNRNHEKKAKIEKITTLKVRN